jgi:hypothetical protein
MEHQIPIYRIPMGFPYNGGNTGTAYHLRAFCDKARTPWHWLQAQASTGDSEANFSSATEALFHRSELACCSFAGLLLLFIVGISV